MMLSRETSGTPELEECPEWKALLTELLAAIAKRLTSIDDYASFRCVCTCWRAAATFHNFDGEFPRVPRLVYFSGKTEETPILLGDDEAPVVGVDDLYDETPVHLNTVANILDLESNTCKSTNFPLNFLDLESNTCKSTNFPPVPDDYKCHYVSCSGWILVGNEPQLSLKHFMLGININLPGLDTFVRKMVLSESPIEAEADLLVMVIYGYDDQLAFCRPGDESWTPIDLSEGYLSEGYFYDIIYHNNKLYALNHSLSILECDIRGSNPMKVVRVFDFPPNVDSAIFILDKHKYLVESFGKFLIVVQYESRSRNESEYFRIFEIELNDGSYKEIDNLGNRCLFLGLNSSICVEVSASSRVKLKPNCIYSAEKKPYMSKPDVGVYTLCDGRFADFSGSFDGPPPPLWVVPSF